MQRFSAVYQGVENGRWNCVHQPDVKIPRLFAEECPIRDQSLSMTIARLDLRFRLFGSLSAHGVQTYRYHGCCGYLHVDVSTQDLYKLLYIKARIATYVALITLINKNNNKSAFAFNKTFPLLTITNECTFSIHIPWNLPLVEHCKCMQASTSSSICIQ